eukprot:14883656-Alexandrium_andersonii.AAC.1
MQLQAQVDPLPGDSRLRAEALHLLPELRVLGGGSPPRITNRSRPMLWAWLLASPNAVSNIPDSVGLSHGRRGTPGEQNGAL